MLLNPPYVAAESVVTAMAANAGVEAVQIAGCEAIAAFAENRTSFATATTIEVEGLTRGSGWDWGACQRSTGPS